MTIKIVNKSSNPLPEYKTKGSSGLDIMASEEVVIRPGDWEKVPTGIYVEIPRGYEGQLRPRSGLAFEKGIGMINSPGTIDSDYRGEIGVLLINHNDAPFFAHVGQRIAQLVIAPVVQVDIEQVEELDKTERGEGGFGHTGMGVDGVKIGKEAEFGEGPGKNRETVRMVLSEDFNTALDQLNSGELKRCLSPND